MAIKKLSWYRQWLEVEAYAYKKDKHIRSTLAQLLDRPHYRALLGAFANEDPVFISRASASTRQTLLTRIGEAERGKHVGLDALPRFDTDPAGRTAISAWIRNACRQDVGLMPESADKGVPVSYNCDPTSARAIQATYNALGIPVEDQKGVIKQLNLRTWGDVLPFVVGVGFASCGTSLSFADALLIPMAGSSFFYDTSLGAVHVVNSRAMIIRSAAASAIATFLHGVSTDVPLPVSEVERRIDREGWTVQRIR